MRLKIRCDGESEKFCKIFWKLNKALTTLEINGREPVPNMHVSHVLIDRAPTLTQYYVSLPNQHRTHAEFLSRSLQTSPKPTSPSILMLGKSGTEKRSREYIVKGAKGTRLLDSRLRPRLVFYLKFFYPSHRIFGHMHRTLNVDKKIN